MAIPVASPFPLTGDPIFDSLTNGGGWLPNTASGTLLTWALADSPTGFFITPAPFATAVDGALAQISAVANIQFAFLGYGPAAAFNADIVVRPGSFSAMYGAAPNVVARAYFPLQGYGADAGDVWLNVDAFSGSYGLADLLPGGKYSFVILHELGHALGLKHPHDSGGTGRPTFVDLGLAEDTKVEFTRGDGFDIDYFTVMSYNDETNFSAFLGDPATLMPLDIYAIQGLYGPNLLTNAGNSQHVLYDDLMQEATWDASGIDSIFLTRTVNDGWIVISNAADAPDVDLPDVLVPVMDGWTLAVPYRGALSGSFQMDEEALKWVYGAEGIFGSDGMDVLLGSYAPDSAFGGGADDALLGYDGNDVLGGAGGDDWIDGGLGFDAAVFDFGSPRYRIQRTGSTWEVADKFGTDGIDELTAVELLMFADKTFDLVNLPRQGVPAYGQQNGFLFDAVFYLLDNAELVPTQTLATALQHYFSAGAVQGKQPNSWFDPTYYENRWPDLKAGNFSDDILFTHYNLYGVWEGRSAGPKFDQFDGNRYLTDNPDVAAYVDAYIADFLSSRINGAIAHYVIYGQHEQRLAFDLVGQSIDLGYTIDLGG